MTDTPTARAKKWALDALISELLTDLRYNADLKRDEARARARIIFSMQDKLVAQKIILDGNVLPAAIEALRGEEKKQ